MSEEDYTILNLDLATSVGWCLVKNGIIVQSGVFDLRTKGSTHPGHRYLKFSSEFLSRFRGVNEIAYESIPFSSHAQAHRVHCGLASHLEVFCLMNRIRLIGINTNTVKKLFTGDGHAEKADICAAAHRMGWKHGEPGTTLDHDEADAVACAVVNLARRGIAVRFK